MFKKEIGVGVRDTKKQITGEICAIVSSEVIRVEYKRYKGDIEPFYITYNLEEQKELVATYNGDNKYKNLLGNPNKMHEYGMTLGELKAKLACSKLPDNAYVLIEREGSEIILDKGTPEESEYTKTWSAINFNKDGYFAIVYNY